MKSKNDEFLMSKERLEQLKNELDNLVKIERPKVIEEIKVARNQGDLSENAEYDAAREKQGIIEGRISELEYIIANSKVIQEVSTKNIVSIGSTVKIKILENTNLYSKDELEIKIVGSLDVDPFNHKISNLSPLANAILNHKVGDIVEVYAPTKYQVKIVKITK
ncbi:transcription elongation factor GreA [Mesomycoplasma neurolyticum]|uniref:Transcription elongation factor GreA n=1 Tax=Mesomycoplasma neurolyticum TaxID=2120 RepID=A0A449A6E2_9BACT|nr:transcription elongation factor GreA [Mesomycoplasma neurolyticum]VEU59789.1 transcription elongation factor [Mesomycoplasma neurolyticum]